MYSVIDPPLSRIAECDICGKEELTDRGYLPPGWITEWNYDWTLCKKCKDKVESQLGYELEYYLKGGEVDPMDQFQQEDFFL